MTTPTMFKAYRTLSENYVSHPPSLLVLLGTHSFWDFYSGSPVDSGFGDGNSWEYHLIETRVQLE